MEIVKKKEHCSPCEENAVLTVGDAVCRSIAKHDNIDCHGLVHEVILKKITLDEYVRKLESKATPHEKVHLDELKRIFKD